MKPLLGSFAQTLQETSFSVDSGDHDLFSHYAPKDEVMEALVNGTPIVALCGKVWVPHRDPSKYKVCPTCKELYEAVNG